MELSYPSYYKTFTCIASDCPDSCCHEWDVQVDEESAARYRSMEGPLGDALREHLYDEEGQTYLRNVDGRCPMWRDDGLCRIQAELGEAALCKTCREFPRLTHDYGDFRQLQLELSCPEAARIIAVTDTFDAMTSVRSYKAAMSAEEAVEIIRKEAGKQFDPKLALIFVELVNSGMLNSKGSCGEEASPEMGE